MSKVLITWAAAWPTITVLLFALDGMLEDWPLLLRTLVLSGLMVSAMAVVIFPALHWLLDRVSKINQGVYRTCEGSNSVGTNI